MIKKLLSIFLTVAMLASFAACGKDDGAKESNPTKTTATAAQKENVYTEKGVSIDKSAFPEDTVLKIEPVASDNDKVTDVKNAIPEAEEVTAYEITATSKNVTVQPNGTVKVSFPIPQIFDSTKHDATVYYVDDEGNIEAVPTEVSNGSINATLTHFSTYVVVITPKSNINVSTEEASATAGNETIIPATGAETVAPTATATAKPTQTTTVKPTATPAPTPKPVFKGGYYSTGEIYEEITGDALIDYFYLNIWFYPDGFKCECGDPNCTVGIDTPYAETLSVSESVMVLLPKTMTGNALYDDAVNMYEMDIQYGVYEEYGIPKTATWEQLFDNDTYFKAIGGVVYNGTKYIKNELRAGGWGHHCYDYNIKADNTVTITLNNSLVSGAEWGEETTPTDQYFVVNSAKFSDDYKTITANVKFKGVNRDVVFKLYEE